MIEKITIKNVATYSAEGVTINDLKKVNFIYGANGSGKTTITNFIDSSDPSEFKDKGCELIWKDTAPLKVLTYNKNFRDKNFGKGKIDGVFTLGDATKEHLDEIAKMQIELATIKDAETQKKTTIETQTKELNELESNFQENCWINIYKKFEYDFNPAFDRYKRKEAFKTKILSEHHSNKRPIKTIAELNEKAKTIFGETPTTIARFEDIDYRRLSEIENNTIWNKKIIGKSDIEIAKLIQRLNLNDWVNQGKQILEKNTEICPFCQKNTIDNDFRNQLEAYFDETFIADTELIKHLSEEYFANSQNIFNILENIEKLESTSKNTKLNIVLFTAYLKTLNQQFISNKERLNNKLKEPSRSVEITSAKEQLDNIQILINNANKEIDKHNAIVANFQSERANLISDVWKLLVEENTTAIDSYTKKADGLQKGVEALKKQKDDLGTKYRELETKIKEANKKVTSVQPSVDAINDTLVAYGFDNFKIVASQTESNQYQIKRDDGAIAEKTLSEGEVTFITFLYFLQLAKGSVSEDSVSEDRILVVDDPISSLDSTVLFVVSSLLKEIIKAVKKGEGPIKQLILLTHNVYFHKEVTFVDKSKNDSKEKKPHFYILRKKCNVSTIQSFESENPIKNSYELLWGELKNRENNSFITIQNTMRRVIEHYFRVLGGYDDEILLGKFENKQEQEICRSLLCWINDGSHCFPDDFFIEQAEDQTDKYLQVFKDIFIKTGHCAHYNMMMGISTDEQA